MYGKNNTETCITICKIDSQQEFAVWLRKLKQGLCFNLEEWGGEGDGREFQKGGGICIPMADRFDRKQKNSVKQLSFNEKTQKRITNKELSSTGSSAQCHVAGLDGRGIGGRMDTCICVTESLHCPPETITTLSVGYTPIQNKKSNK